MIQYSSGDGQWYDRPWMLEQGGIQTDVVKDIVDRDAALTEVGAEL
jgi:hypothetical protein